MNRKQFLSMLLSAVMVFSILPVTARAAFSDTEGHWAKNAITRWSDLGIVQGLNGSFRPDDSITRGEMATIIDRVMNYQVKADNGFADLGQAFYTDAVLKANAAGVMKGDGALVRPNDKITREEAEVMLGHALATGETTTNEVNFADFGTISAWAAGYVNAMRAKGYIASTERKFRPKENITRAEVVTILDNAIKGFYNKAGTYSGDVIGTVVVNTADVVLENMTIRGDLIISEGVGDGNATLNNVKVEGNTIIRGGGVNSFKVMGTSSLGNVIVAKTDGKVRVFTDGKAIVDIVEIIDGSDDVIIEGVIGSLEIQAKDITVTAQSAQIADVQIDAEGTGFIVDKNSIITNIVISTPNTDIGISGRVTSIYADKTAEGASITAKKGAVIASVRTEASKTEIKGDGTVRNAEIKANDVKIDTVGTKIQVDGNITGTISNGKELAGGTTSTNGAAPSSTGGGGSGTPDVPSITLSGASFNEEGTVLTFGCSETEASFQLDGLPVTPVYENNVYTISGIPMAQKEYTLTASKSGYTSASKKIVYTLTAVEVLLSEVDGVYYPLVWGVNNYDLVPQPEVTLEAVGDPANTGITISTQGVLSVPVSYKGTITITARLASPALTSAPLTKEIAAKAATVSFVSPVTSIAVPAAGTVTQQYSATVKDQTGTEMVSPVTYSLKSNVNGVSITTAGLVTVASTAAADQFTVVATADNTVTAEQAVTLVAASARDVAIAALNSATEEAEILAVLQNATHIAALGFTMTTFDLLDDSYQYDVSTALLNKGYALSDTGKASAKSDFDIAVTAQAQAQAQAEVNAKAAAITVIAPPAKDSILLTLPAVGTGYTVAIKTSSDTDIIATDGTVTPPALGTTVALVLTLTHTDSGKTANTSSINVVVPAKTQDPATGLQFAPESDSGEAVLAIVKKDNVYEIYFEMKKNLDPVLNEEKIDLSKLCVKKSDTTTQPLVDDKSAYTAEESYTAGSYHVETSTVTEGSGAGAVSYISTVVRIYLNPTDGAAITNFLAGYNGEIKLAALDGWYDGAGAGGEKPFAVNYRIPYSNDSSKPVLCCVYTDADGKTTVWSANDESGIDSLSNIDNTIVRIDVYSEPFLNYEIPTTGFIIRYTDMEAVKASGVAITGGDWTELQPPTP